MKEPTAPARPGAVLGSRYRLDALIGRGSFGSVFRGVDIATCRAVAVKVLGTRAGTDPEALARFRREGAAAWRVRHPNVVTVLDFGLDEAGVAYLVMELLSGRPLDAELAEAGTLSPRRAAQILAPVCRALAAAHAAGVVHRDVKPSNVFLHRTPAGEEVPKVLDFGIARLVSTALAARSLTLDGALLGTPAYMAPERFGRQPYGPESDVYSVGTMLYEMLSGRLPFARGAEPLALVAAAVEGGPPPLSPRAGITPEIERLVREALAKDPAARPTAERLAELLTRFALQA